MRRMYSEQELTNVIKKVFEEELESGALDELVSDAVDAYLVEHPVDITALEGQDVELNSLDADGLITGGEIVEKMSGYSFNPASSGANSTLEYVYTGAVKNGNKLTFAIALYITKIGSSEERNVGIFYIPSVVANKLYPALVGEYNYLAIQKVTALQEDYAVKQLNSFILKPSSSSVQVNVDTTEMDANKKTYVRIEVTFLLSDTLIPEE